MENKKIYPLLLLGKMEDKTMLKFTMNAKELKTMMEKGVVAIDKKAALSSLTRLYFQVEADGTVKALGMDMEHFAEIRSNNAWNTSPGVLGIDVDDIKVLTKMSGDITLEDVSTEKECKINIQCGKKNVTIPKYMNTDIFLPGMDNTEEKIFTVKENWLLETIANLAIYTSDNDSNKMMQVFNFNAKSERIEALDGYRIGMRTLQNQIIHVVDDSPFNTVKIHNKCVSVFKKIMDKKSEKEVVISQDKKYIKIEGNDFTYMIRRIEGEYFKVDQLLNFSEEYRFIANRKNILEVMKYDAELVKLDNADRKPVVLHSENGNLYSYIRTAKYEAFEELETMENNMDAKLYIGFNSQFLADVFNIVDSENPVCIGTNAKAPMIITGNEYSFLVLPINITQNDYTEKFTEHINRSKAA